MQPWTERLRKQQGPGVLLSVLLHGLLLLASLWYLGQRPVLTQTQFHALPVDLVIGASIGDGALPATRLRIAPPRPQSAPRPVGTNPAGITQPQDELSAKLRALAQLKSTDTRPPNADTSARPSGAGGDEANGNYALKDFIRAQILRRWLPDLSIPGARDMPVLVRIRLLKNGVIADVTIVDQERFYLDRAFRDMALSARDAALLASPIQIPGARYEKTQTLTIALDPRAALR
ncbi:MAG TPA: hypothetical protein VJ750_04230 [Rhizomicrobium sp.]|nr:hypothetical protein [Rhizomicrobium sp.]